MPIKEYLIDRVDSPEELWSVFEKYFEACDSANRPYTISGIADVCGATHFSTLYDWLGYKGKEPSLTEPYRKIVEKAFFRVATQLEEKIYDSQARNVIGPMFALKNGWGWSDKIEVEHSGKVAMEALFDHLATRKTFFPTEQEILDVESEIEKRDQENTDGGNADGGKYLPNGSTSELSSTSESHSNSDLNSNSKSTVDSDSISDSDDSVSISPESAPESAESKSGIESVKK